MADLKTMLDQGTRDGLRIYGQRCSRKFYELLHERRLASTRCRVCGHLAFPPRDFCPNCFGVGATGRSPLPPTPGAEMEWVDLPRQGTLYAFTQQERAVRFGKPDVIGLVELAGGIRLFTRIDGKFAALRLGQPVELDFLELSPGLTLHQFRPSGT